MKYLGDLFKQYQFVWQGWRDFFTWPPVGFFYLKVKVSFDLEDLPEILIIH